MVINVKIVAGFKYKEPNLKLQTENKQLTFEFYKPLLFVKLNLD